MKEKFSCKLRERKNRETVGSNKPCTINVDCSPCRCFICAYKTVSRSSNVALSILLADCNTFSAVSLNRAFRIMTLHKALSVLLIPRVLLSDSVNSVGCLTDYTAFLIAVYSAPTSACVGSVVGATDMALENPGGFLLKM